MDAKSRAFIVHRTPTRIRIKIPGRRRHQAYFAALEWVLIQDPNFFSVESNSLTASVIIECRAGLDLTAQQRQFLGLEMIETSDVGRANSPRGYLVACADDTFDLSEGGFTLAVLILKIILAITTKQFGVQLIEWLIEACFQASREEARRRATHREPLLLAAVK
jgi:hypothetical protein